MEHISSLLNISSLDVKREEHKASNHLDPHVSEVVNYVFLVFFGVCRGFEKYYADIKKLNIEKTQWILQFTNLGLNSLEKVKLGIENTRANSPINPPSLKEFIDWCKPNANDFELLTKEQAYKKAFEIMRLYPDDPKDLTPEQLLVINNAIRETGRFELRTQPDHKSRPIFERNYEIAVRDFLAGKLKPIPKAIENKQTPEPEQNTGKGYAECMPIIKKILGMEKYHSTAEPAVNQFRQFDYDKITPGLHGFDQGQYDDYRTYLMALSDFEATLLPPKDAYRRIRFLSVKDGQENIRKLRPLV